MQKDVERKNGRKAHFCPVLHLIIGVISAFTLGSSSALARDNIIVPGGLPDKLKDVTITEKLGQNVPIEQLKFRNEQGQEVALSSFVKPHQPLVLSLAYYKCPHLCTLVLNGLTDTLKQMEWTPGPEGKFQVVTVSIEPKETPELAAEKKLAYLEQYGRKEAGSGWHFLTGTEENISKLADSVGFGYRWDPAEGQYAHGAALFVLTPEGKISRYLYGVQFSPADMRMALTEASNGKIGTLMDRFLMFCFKYNPHSRKYTLVVTRIVQVASLTTALILGLFITMHWRRSRKDALDPC